MKLTEQAVSHRTARNLAACEPRRYKCLRVKTVMFKKLTYCLFILSMFSVAFADEGFNISATLMRSTFKIQEGNNIGTVFILGQPMESDNTRAYYILFTATHVLESMKANFATLFIRKFENENFVKIPIRTRIRNEGRPLWISHPQVDVAAMRISLPRDTDIQLISTEMIADDKFIKSFEVNPGDDLLVLGYPYGAEANEAGFPILRSGRIANYPLTPTKSTKTFLLDFEVFGGNSGAPVFMCSRNRAYGGSTHIGVVSQLMGIVIQEKHIVEHVKTMEEETLKKHKLSLAVVVHASFLRELLPMLPPVASN